MPANRTAPAAASWSIGTRTRRRGRASAPAIAPTPRLPRSNPYCGASRRISIRASTGRRANRALAGSANPNTRARRTRISGAWRTYRTPTRIAPTTSSGGRVPPVAGRFHRYRTTRTPAKETAFRAKVAAGPPRATRSPPRAGPTARATLIEMPLRVTALGSRDGPTSSGRIALNAGAVKAVPIEISTINRRRIAGDIAPARAIASITTAMPNSQPWAARRKSRRSTTSANAPAGIANANTGNVVAVSTRAMSSGEIVRDVISHTSPTSWTHVPTFDTVAATQRARNTRTSSAAHGDAEGGRPGTGSSGSDPRGPLRPPSFRAMVRTS